MENTQPTDIATSRANQLNLDRKYRRRAKCLMRKAHELSEKCDAKVYLVIQRAKNKKFQVFLSTTESWPPSLEDIVSYSHGAWVPSTNRVIVAKAIPATHNHDTRQPQRMREFGGKYLEWSLLRNCHLYPHLRVPNPTSLLVVECFCFLCFVLYWIKLRHMSLSWIWISL